MHPEDPSEDLRLQFISAVPQCWADRGHYSYLDSPRPEDALLFFLPEESGCSFTLYLDSGALFHPKQGDIFYTPRGSRFALQVDNPAHPHLNQPHGPKIITNLCVKFLTQEMDGQPARLGEFSLIVPSAGLAGQCELLLRQLTRLYWDIHGSPLLLQAKLYELIYLLRQSSVFTEKRFWALQPALEHIRRNLSGGLSIPQLAELCGMSEAAFYRAFRAGVGLSPKQYWLRLRLDKAAELLRSSRLPVTEIARKTGFCDSNYLTKCFTRRFALSPRAYRKMNSERRVQVS